VAASKCLTHRDEVSTHLVVGQGVDLRHLVERRDQDLEGRATGAPAMQSSTKPTDAD
jgi:hypothetical protein